MMKKLIQLLAVMAIAMFVNQANAQWTATGAVVHPATLTNNVSIGTTVNGANLYVERSAAVTLGIKSTTAGATMFMDKGSITSNAAFAYRYLGAVQWNSGMLGSNNFSIRNVPLNSFPLIINGSNDNMSLCSLGGLVGIGTTTPTEKLHVQGNILSTNVISALGGNSTNWNTAFSWGNHATAGYLTSYTETDPQVGVNTIDYIPKWDGSALTTSAIAETGGRVGIGTATPTSNLEVVGATNTASIQLRSLTGAALFILNRKNATDAGTVNFSTDGVLGWQAGHVFTNDFSIRNYALGTNALVCNLTNNNVGIGTNTPTEKLHVQGNILATNVISALGGNSTNWNTAYTWGNHATAGYISTESDPQVGANTTNYLSKWDGTALVASNVIETATGVGIGTTPASRLHVAGTNNQAQIVAANTNDSTAAINFTTPYTTWTMGQNRPAGSLTLADYFYIKKSDLSTPSLIINTAGNMGIGNTAPSEKLHVTGNALITGNSIVTARVGFPIVNSVTKVNIEDTHVSDAWIRLVNTTKGPNISWAGIGASGDWTIRSSANTGVVGMQDQAGGRIGLGTTNPIVGVKVEIKGETGANTVVFTPATGNQSWVHNGANGDWYIRSANSTAGKVILQDIGSAPVCIGTTQAATGYKVSVGGKVMCEEIKVQLRANWPDYVFDNDYKQMSIEEIAKYIETHKHLPGIPSAAEVNNNGGIELGEMQRLLLEKMEELMLQNIQQQKEIESLKKLVVKN